MMGSLRTWRARRRQRQWRRLLAALPIEARVFAAILLRGGR
jgi:hypothetical protein